MVTWYLESGGLLSVVLAQPFLHTPDLSTPEHEACCCFEIHRPVELSRLLSPFQRLAEPSWELEVFRSLLRCQLDSAERSLPLLRSDGWRGCPGSCEESLESGASRGNLGFDPSGFFSWTLRFLCKRHPSFLTCPKKSLGYRIKSVYLAAFNFEAIGRIVIPPALILTNYGNKG